MSSFEIGLLYLLLLLAGLVASCPLVLGLVVCVKFPRRGVHPFWLALIMCGLTAGSAVVLYHLPYIGDFVSVLMIAGTVFCGVAGAAALIHWVGGIAFWRAFVIATLAVLPGWLWLDLRFRVVVQDPEGRAVEVREGDITLHHPPRGLFQSYVTEKGLRLKKGTTYFGFVRWLRFKEQWTFLSTISDRDGCALGEFEPARWSAWPIVVTTPPQP